MKTRTTCSQCGEPIPESLHIPKNHVYALCTQCRYHRCSKAKSWDAPDEWGNAAPEQPEGVVEFQYPGEEPDPVAEEWRDVATEAVRRFLRLLTSDSTALCSGQRAKAVAYLEGLTEYKTHREFASALNVTPGRATQILQSLPSKLKSMARLRNRTAKARPPLGAEIKP